MADTVETVQGQPSVLKDFTDDKLTQVTRRAALLLSQDDTVNKICSTLIVSRQLYAMARLALQRSMQEEGYEWKDGIEELLIKAMADRANKPYTRAAVLRDLTNIALPLVQSEIKLEQKAERKKYATKAQNKLDIDTDFVETVPRSVEVTSSDE